MGVIVPAWHNEKGGECGEIKEFYVTVRTDPAQKNA